MSASKDVHSKSLAERSSGFTEPSTHGHYHPTCQWPAGGDLVTVLVTIRIQKGCRSAYHIDFAGGPSARDQLEEPNVLSPIWSFEMNNLREAAPRKDRI